jgi:hypothetical protein
MNKVKLYMFWTTRPSSGVQVVVVRDSAARCNAVFFPPTIVASGYFGYVGCTLFVCLSHATHILVTKITRSNYGRRNLHYSEQQNP